MNRTMMVTGLLAGALSLAPLAYAQPGGGTANQNQASPADRQIYGWQLMTPQERQTYQNQMRNLRTQQERDQFRLEHHQLMQERARERGVTLPDQPMGGGGPGAGGTRPGYGQGNGGMMGPGNGNSGMMGPGGGTGPGRR